MTKLLTILSIILIASLTASCQYVQQTDVTAYVKGLERKVDSLQAVINAIPPCEQCNYTEYQRTIKALTDEVDKLTALLAIPCPDCPSCPEDSVIIPDPEPAASFEGFGATKGAYTTTDNPTILTVNTLSDASIQTGERSGSFRWCISQNYPRVIKSVVTGTIDAQSFMLLTNPYVSIDMTGITTKRYPVEVRTHDVVVQNLRSRAGTEMPGITLGDRDAFRIAGTAYKVVIDHCSIEWGCDENFSFLAGAHDITVSNCIIAEALMWTSGYSYGMLINDNCKNISLIKNAWLMNSNRNPLISNNCTVEFINNLIYTPRFNGVDFKSSSVSIKGSVKIGTSNSYIARARDDGSGQTIYLEDNISASGFQNESGTCRVLTSPTVDSKNYVQLPASQVESYLIQNAGAFPRDAVDTRIINELINRAGTIKTHE